MCVLKEGFALWQKRSYLKANLLNILEDGVLGAFPVKRNSQDIESIKKAMQVIKNGDILGIFPEGTRNGMAKNVKTKNGAAFLVAKTGAKVIPVGIQGNFKPFSRIIINYGKPLDFSKYQSKNPNKEDLQVISEEIMNSIILLTNEKK